MFQTEKVLQTSVLACTISTQTVRGGASNYYRTGHCGCYQDDADIMSSSSHAVLRHFTADVRIFNF